MNLLNKHNQFRWRVSQGLENQGNPGPQPAALNMPELVRLHFCKQ